MSKSKKLEIGSHNKLPHYSVIGNATDFYIWVNEDGRGQNSEWIKGKSNLYYKLSNLFSKKKQEFINELKKAFHAHSTEKQLI